jgi:hypothetical protein
MARALLAKHSHVDTHDRYPIVAQNLRPQAVFTKLGSGFHAAFSFASLSHRLTVDWLTRISLAIHA